MLGLDKQIAFLLTSIGSVGIMYFLGVAAGLPFWAIASLEIFLAVGIIRLYKYTRFPYGIVSGKQAYLSWALLILGVALITNRSFYTATPHGAWDAWGMWNLKARGMSDGRYWSVFLREAPYQHNDYPLMLPSFNAFWMRLCGPRAWDTISFITAFLTTLFIPVWIYSRLVERHIILAASVLLLFATDDYYLYNSLLQYADGMLGAFFLGAIILHDQAVSASDNKLFLLTGFFLGCCIWTKNEGIALFGITTIFWIKELWKKQMLQWFLIGAAIPVLAWLVFKVGWPTPNDLVSPTGSRDLMAYIQDSRRYEEIWMSLKTQLSTHFFWTLLMFWTTVVICLLSRKLPSRNLTITVSCLAAYDVVYLFSPHELAWHLGTSHDRLLFQLQPAFVYSAALQILDTLPNLQSHCKTELLH